MKKKQMLRDIAEMRTSIKNCALHIMTFKPIPMELKKGMEIEMKRSFDIWANSWIIPRLDSLEKELRGEKP